MGCIYWDDSKEILKYLTNEANEYFLKDFNTVNTHFQKREPLVQEDTRDLFNSTINIILLNDYRTMNIGENWNFLNILNRI